MAKDSKKSKERKPPPWLLSAEWGIGIDSYNWKLYRRLKTRWNVVGHYPTLRMLANGLQEKVALTDQCHPTFVAHVKSVIEESDKLTKAMLEQVRDMEVGLDTKPPKYATFSS
jgi:hypothetical protein